MQTLDSVLWILLGQKEGRTECMHASGVFKAEGTVRAKEHLSECPEREISAKN